MSSAREQAELARARFLQELRERVAWQADAADRSRRGEEPETSNVVAFPQRSRDEEHGQTA